MPTPNSAIDLQALVNGQYDRPAAWAQNLLCFGYGRCRPPLTGGRTGEQRRFTATTQGQPEKLVQQRLWAQPNPATQYTEIHYRLGHAPVDAWIFVRDILGQEQQRFKLPVSHGQVLWDTRQIPPGTYTAELMDAGARIFTDRIIVRP